MASIADEYDSPLFREGFHLGKVVGKSDAVTEAQAAFDAGEIELWLEARRAKTSEDWDAFYAQHKTSYEEMQTRWIKTDKDE